MPIIGLNAYFFMTVTMPSTCIPKSATATITTTTVLCLYFYVCTTQTLYVALCLCSLKDGSWADLRCCSVIRHSRFLLYVSSHQPVASDDEHDDDCRP